MSNGGQIRYVFTSSNTINGFYTFIPELMEGLRKVYILKGAAGSGKSTFIRLLGESLYEQGYEVEFWVSALDALNPDGVYIPQLESAVVNGSLPQPVDPKYPGACEEIINLGEFYDKSVLESKCKQIVELVNCVAKDIDTTGEFMKSAGRVKEEIKKITAAHLNIEKIKNLVQTLTEEIIQDNPREKHYFASAVTVEGVVSYVDEISRSCRKRYIFRGPAGSGKSTVINELAAIFKEKGYFLEYYHSGIDQESIEMIIIQNLSLALVDAGNIEINAKPGDVVIDMTEYLDNYEMDEADIKSSEAYRNYETFLLQARMKLEDMHNSLKELKKIYSGAMDFESVDKKREEIRAELTKNNQ